MVTGSGGNGSGRAIACRFARDGAAVVVSDIDDAGGRETVRRIQSTGGRAEFFHTDVGIQDQVRDLVAFAEKTFGGLNVLVNNASGPDFRPDAPLELWTETAATDLFGTMYATRFAIDAMRRGGGGRNREHELDIRCEPRSQEGHGLARLRYRQGRHHPVDHHARMAGRTGEHPRELPCAGLDRHGACSRLLGIADPRSTCRPRYA